MTKPWSGPGAWVWDVREQYDNDHDLVITQAKDFGFSWVTVKGADGPHRWTRQLSREVVDLYHAAGLKILGWSYVYGVDVASEVAANLWMAEQGVDGVILDTEAEIRDANALAIQRGSEIPARSLCRNLRTSLGWDYPLAYAPLPIPQYHGNLCYDIFENEFGCASMPQFYSNQIRQFPTADMFSNWVIRRGAIPDVPVFGAYPGEVFVPDLYHLDQFEALARQYGCEGFSFWRMDTLADLGTWYRPQTGPSRDVVIEIQLGAIWGWGEREWSETLSGSIHAAVSALVSDRDSALEGDPTALEHVRIQLDSLWGYAQLSEVEEIKSGIMDAVAALVEAFGLKESE